ncbi:MAG TPA: CopG family transcriptional regulator [Thermoanaerobaculia bacterium]|nr:CopG family transcriptional regulator [Thermoanaerobaculia bacterium]
MKRTTIYLDPDQEVLLKLEALRSKRSMTDVLREALRSYLSGLPRQVPPGAGAFDSGHTETGERAEELLGELGFATENGR